MEYYFYIKNKWSWYVLPTEITMENNTIDDIIPPQKDKYYMIPPV